MKRERATHWRVVLAVAAVVVVGLTVALVYLQRELDTHLDSPDSKSAGTQLERVEVAAVSDFRSARGGEPQRVPGFALHRTEVTEGAFARCVEAGHCAERMPAPCHVMRGLPTHPVACVSWVQARAFCVWSGGRLPTSAEWELAARGPGGAPYVWGDEGAVAGNFARDIVPGHDDGFPGTAPVGWTGDVSAVGALDMAGNVSEWVEDCVGCADALSRAALGGSFVSGELEEVSTSSRRVLDGASRPEIGFRCAFPPGTSVREGSR